jgi:glycine hydroxymethyltransferase
LFSIDLRPVGLNGNKADYILEEVSITVNKNTVPGDKNALSPSGIRIGTPALTSRGLVEKDMLQVADFIDQAFQIAIEINKKAASGTFKDFKEAAPHFKERIHAIKEKVQQYAENLPLPGFEDI